MNALILLVVLASVLLSLAAMVCLAVWVYRDAKARGLNAALWTAVVLLVPSFIGLLLYLLIGRNQTVGLCPACGAGIQGGIGYCPRCGKSLGDSGEGAEPMKPLPKTGKGALIAFIVCIAVMVVGLISFTILGLVAFNSNLHSGVVSNYAVGKVENHMANTWHMTFNSLEGEQRNDQLVIGEGAPKTLHVKSTLGSGKLTLELRQGDTRVAVDLSSPQNTSDVDLSDFQPGPVQLMLISDGAKNGNLDIWWD